MALDNTIKEVIKTIDVQKYKEMFKEENLKVKTDADFKKYLKKKSQDLLKMVNNKKKGITKYDFCLLLKQKLTNALGKNKRAVDSNLFNKYNTFPSQYHLVDLSENNYYNTYEQLKKEIIEKVKKYNKTKWVKAVPNKLKKQSTHLMGEAKLKSLSDKLGNKIKKVIDTIDVQKYKEIFNEKNLKVKSDADFEKYLKKKSQDLLKMVNNEKKGITKYDFCLLLKQKLTNELGKNKGAMDSNLLNKYNTFPSQYHLVDLSENNYYNTYEQLKKEIIEKVKKYNNKKWIKAIPNKLKKQATHLLGEAKLKSLSDKDEDVLKKMAKENRLTLPDFRMALKYKLINKYIGEISNKVYNSTQNKHNFCEELKTFYDDKTFYDNIDFKNNKDRNQIIENIYSNYISIINIIQNPKIIKMKILNKDVSITFSDFTLFVKNSAICKNKWDALIKTFKEKENIRHEWLVKTVKNYQSISLEVKEALKDDKINEFSKDRSYKDVFVNSFNKLNSNSKQHEYLFNLFKLFDYNDIYDSSDFCLDFSFIFPICFYEILYENECNNNFCEDYGILNSTKEKIEKLIEKAKKSNEIQELLKNMPNPPTRPIPPPKPSHLKKPSIPKKPDYLKKR